MKKLIASLSILSFLSCESETDYAIQNPPKLYYFKDSAANLCFARTICLVKGGIVNSITCVPCDSIERLFPKPKKPEFTE